MQLSQRVTSISESVTLKLNAQAVALAESGKEIFNLTAGQLPFRPLQEYIDLIRSETDFIRSFQYSPVAGYPELRKKLIAHIEESRSISLGAAGVEYDCIISNGAKHSLSNILGALVEQDDEVVILSPYWTSYPEMIKFCKATPVAVSSTIFEVFIPPVTEIEKAITPKTKAIIINSPTNPTGTHYDEQWMRDFGEMIKKYPEISIISDEIYYQLSYFDPKPTYFYQFHPELLNRTIIVDGISKILASTGLRIGWAFAPKELVQAITRLQGQTTSGANSLVQRALINFDFKLIDVYLEPIKKHLRDNATVLCEAFREAGQPQCWYQSVSAFYFLVDFSQTPVIGKFKESAGSDADVSGALCEELLKTEGVAMVPGHAFGAPNTARMALVLEKEPFKEAV
ncbi:MAG: aminotransferase class I/II-fold pyridoxal phosphate-dependent enzyme, partial [Halobacteriovoraceae bacterium]|nr:aminotransferase class I/II-fold pyridoxal phosphate-dependent enzyme [Halobacteriovoraceae bacterium]